jgi:hypothetical protein
MVLAACSMDWLPSQQVNWGPRAAASVPCLAGVNVGEERVHPGGVPPGQVGVQGSQGGHPRGKVLARRAGLHHPAFPQAPQEVLQMVRMMYVSASNVCVDTITLTTMTGDLRLHQPVVPVV